MFLFKTFTITENYSWVKKKFTINHVKEIIISMKYTLQHNLISSIT